MEIKDFTFIDKTLSDGFKYTVVLLENNPIFYIDEEEFYDVRTFKIRFGNTIPRWILGFNEENDVYFLKTEDNNFKTLDEAKEKCKLILIDFLKYFLK